MTSDEMVEKGSAKKTGMHQESYKVDSVIEAKNKNTYIYAMQVLKGNLFQFDVAKVESLDIQVETREVYV
ncbi:hypothetical protein BELL_0025g00310 [Botrytis elliptica]|uniref:Uncharacterized protein n=1 Tax=Botrytis elliptica TaxID=278938 RepID=A0A4Z1K841_9HELO|nr:hypothetical protein BELL_0025g00310 [Botrytis elliptica]